MYASSRLMPTARTMLRALALLLALADVTRAAETTSTSTITLECQVAGLEYQTAAECTCLHKKPVCPDTCQVCDCISKPAGAARALFPPSRRHYDPEGSTHRPRPERRRSLSSGGSPSHAQLCLSVCSSRRAMRSRRSAADRCARCSCCRRRT